MRIYLHLTPNREPVPFDYQQYLVGAFHKWLGENELHDDISLYSLSWLSHGVATKSGLDFPNGSIFFISSFADALLANLIQGVFKGSDIRWGMEVHEVTIQRTPDFGEEQRFLAQSPILVKRKEEGAKHHRYYFPGDPGVDTYLTHTLQHKLKKADLDYEVDVRFDPGYDKPRIKKNRFNNIDIKSALCPVIVSGHPRAVQFAWEVGVGNSTGIGFGALR